MAAALFDFGVWFFLNARELVDRGAGPYVYLPKLESHAEAALWHDVFSFSEDVVGLPRGSIRATVLIETILAAFEMDEILHALGEHATALNAGRWDYIFSVIKELGGRPEFLLPDRAQVTMAVPFMRAYADLLVKTCHRRGAHAIGGMAAFIPSRRDPSVNEIALANVRDDKEREAGAADGTWVAHPDLVPVATEVFDRVLGEAPNQLGRARDDVGVTARDLLDVHVPGGSVTADGLHANAVVGLGYLTSWLRGVGAAAIDNLMEDAATAEISRSQVWQWLHHGVALEDGRTVTPELVRRVLDDAEAVVRGQVDVREVSIARALRGSRDGRGLRGVPHDPRVRAPLGAFLAGLVGRSRLGLPRRGLSGAQALARLVDGRGDRPADRAHGVHELLPRLLVTQRVGDRREPRESSSISSLAVRSSSRCDSFAAPASVDSASR